ncbi:hypothetical protein JCM8208_000972 [Rhodotorula glutinis]
MSEMASSVVFTATATVGEAFSTTVLEATHAGGHSINILNGDNPIVVNTANPLLLVIVQLCIILALSRGLAFVFGRFRVPRVVCEIVAGILLGPTAFGRVPGFTENIFPPESISYLTLISNLGLVLFLFCVGTDVDFSLLRRNAKPTVAVSAAGLIIPFALGCGVSFGLYGAFIPDDVSQTTFLVFIGTSMSITAFPVLSRILGDLHLFQDPVGLVVLASGVVNDVLGWCLLSLAIALASSGSGVVVVYVLCCLVGLWLFLYFICRPALVWLARKTGSFSRPDGPTQGYVCAVLALVLVAAWFAQVVGSSEIFGGFLVGLIIPRSLGHHFAAKIEDLILCLFLPLYFATSGLNTDLTLLNTGTIWGWTVCVMVVAFLSKFLGSALASRATGFSWRQAGAVGSLMSAKGLIELIVLGQGLAAGIITQTVFSIFVLEAVVLTLAATPLALAFYPPHVRPSAQNAASSADSKDLARSSSSMDKPGFGGVAQQRTRFAIVLDQLEALGGAMVLTHLLAAGSSSVVAPASSAAAPAGAASGTLTSDDTLLSVNSATAATSAISASRAATPGPSSTAPLSLTPLRLVELTERTSGVMLASEEAATHLARDPLVALVRTFASLFAGRVALERGEFAMTGLENWAETVARCAKEGEQDMLLLSWRLGGGKGEVDQPGVVESFIPNPFEALFGNPSANPPSASTANPNSAAIAGAPLSAAFVRDVFLDTSCDVGVLLDRSSTSLVSPAGAPRHLFLPFFGGADDRACLSLLAQLVRRAGGALSATVLVLERAPEPTAEDRDQVGDAALEVKPTETGGDGSSSSPAPLASPALSHLHTFTHGHGHGHGLTTRAGETHYGSLHAPHGLASETADDVALSAIEALAATTTGGGPGVLRVERVQTAFPLGTLRRRVGALTEPTLVLVGRSRVDAPSHRAESRALLEGGAARGSVAASSEVRRAVGEAGTALLLGEASAAAEYVLVVQSERTAGRRREKRMAALKSEKEDEA